MIAKDLKDKWDKINDLPRSGDYHTLLVSSESYAEISVAISPDANRCLLLALPPGYNADFVEIIRENLKLGMVSEQNYVSVTLLDLRFIDLFDDLIVSMHNAICDVRSVDEYCRIFLQTFNKWSQFFERAEQVRFSDIVIRGIFGELKVLQKVIVDTPASGIDSVLESWRGPYDQGQDFIFEDLNIEVKTRSTTNSSVIIANEDQLDQTDGKRLELAVVTLEMNETEGQTLEILVQEIVKAVESFLGDTTILYRALRQKNLSPENFKVYDNLIFKAHKIYIYDCILDSFPHLVRSKLPYAIFNIRYSLNTAELESYLTEEIEL